MRGTIYRYLLDINGPQRMRAAKGAIAMCLAVPGKIIDAPKDGRATVDMMGAQREISLRLVPDAAAGDFVLVHAGFGIQVISPEEAQETIDLLQELPELMVDDLAHEATA